MEVVQKLNKRMPVSAMLDPKIVIPAIGSAFVKLDPRAMIKSPVMFVVEIVAALTAVIFLRDPNEVKDNPRIARRVEITKELIGGDTPTHEIWAEGGSFLARMFFLIYIADFVTVYLAILNNICPTDMATLEYLKSEMAKVPE